MKKILTSILFMLFIAAISLLFIPKLLFHKTTFIPSQENEMLAGNENERTDGPEKLMRQEFLMARDPALNIVPTERIIEAKRKMDEMELATARGSGSNNTLALTWQERGPNNIGGRTRALLVDRSDASGNTVFAAGVGGGLWKTTNFKTTATWAVINDFFSNIAITCIKQSPTDPLVMYFGTGEGFANADAIDGLGIWKSTNGGTSWTQLSSTINIVYVNDLEFDNNGYIYAATRSTVAGLRGIIRSTDAGANWTQVLTDPIPTATTRGADLERAANGDMYATLGIRSTGHIFLSIANGTNTGLSGSWTNITPSSVITNKDQRIELAVCPNNSSRIYAISQDSITATAGGGIANIFRSDNSGGTWATLTNPNWCDGNTTKSDFSRGQGWYDLILGVDPNNDAIVLAGGVVVMETTNSGSTWTQATRWTSGSCSSAPIIHADIHEIQFLNSNELIICTDGGIYYSTDGGASFVNKNGGYNVTQYYGVAVNPTSGSNYMLAGAQDNGSHKFTTAGINSVISPTGGDGGFCFINQTDPNYQITSFTNAAYNRSTNGGSSFTTVVNTSNGRFINPTDLDNKTNFLYFGYSDGEYGHYDVTNGGITFINLTASPSSLSLTNLQVSAVKADTNATNTIWLAFSTSETASANVVPCLVKVIQSDGPSSGNPSLKPVGTKFNLPAAIPAGAYVSNIDIEPGNSNHMLLTVSNYGVASVWESTDGGTNWNSLDNNGVNLPDMPIRWAIFTPSGYLAGRTSSVGGAMLATELGVWTTTSLNGTSTIWTAQNSGLANVRTDQLVLRNSDKLIAAATHGRGVFTTFLLTTPLPLTVVDFTGTRQNKNVLLEWTTSSEYNSKNFELEKSYDGVNYHKIATQPAAGNSNSLIHYSWLDMEQLSQNNYYRLMTVDMDGKGKLSNTVLIKLPDAQQGMYILGNPFHDNISIRFIQMPQGKIVFRLTDISGKLISQTVFSQQTSGQIQFSVPSARLSKGVYLLKAMVDGKVFTERLIKQ